MAEDADDAVAEASASVVGSATGGTGTYAGVTGTVTDHTGQRGLPALRAVQAGQAVVTARLETETTEIRVERRRWRP